MPEEQGDVMEKMQEMGQEFNKVKKSIIAHFKDYEIDIRDWNFAVGKADKEYVIDLKAKVAIKPKSSLSGKGENLSVTVIQVF